MLNELSGGSKPKAATVTPSFILGVLKSTYGQEQFKSAVAGAVAYDKCKAYEGDQRVNCQLDKAMVNVGSILAAKVEGRVSTEVDPRISNDTDAIVKRVESLQTLYTENKVPADKLLYAIPGTWEGIQAVKQLEAKGTQCHVVHVYSLVQAVAAAQAKASVIQVNVGRVDDWYKKHPGFIRDPTGPREDSGLVSDVDPGVCLMAKIYDHVKAANPASQVMATGIRTKKQALALAGIDYIVTSSQVVDTLAAAATLSGFNDGLHGGDSAQDIEVQLSVESAKAATLSLTESITQAIFVDELGYMGFDLLKAGVEGAASNIERCGPFFSGLAGGQE